MPTRSQTESETASARGDLFLRDAGKGPFQQLVKLREDEAEADRRATSATQRMVSCGRCSADSNAEPTRVTTLKLSTKPPITR